MNPPRTESSDPPCSIPVMDASREGLCDLNEKQCQNMKKSRGSKLAIWTPPLKQLYDPFSSWMRSEGSRFTLGVWGWGCVCQKLLLRPQPFATVRNRSQPFATFCASAVRLLMRKCNWSGAESVSSCLVTSQLYWRLQRSSVWVICGVAVILAFAEEVSPWVISYKSVKGECSARVSIRSECPTRLSSQSVLQKCQESVSSQSVL